MPPHQYDQRSRGLAHPHVKTNNPVRELQAFGHRRGWTIFDAVSSPAEPCNVSSSTREWSATSNPAIFEKAITRKFDYTDVAQAPEGAETDAQARFERLAD